MTPLAACALVLLSVASSQTPNVRIVSPDETEFVTGPVTIRLAVSLAGDELRAITVQANGVRVCRLVARPYECQWDAGPVIRAHQIRVIAEFVSGVRSVANVRTAAVDATEDVAVKSVLVGVHVTDRRGRAVPGLTRDDFALKVGGRAVPIGFFGAEELPLEILVALDISGSMNRHVPEMRRAVRAFTENLREHDRLALGAFNTNLFVLAPLSAPGTIHLRAADRLSAFGGTALNDAIIQSLSALPGSGGRRVLIFFTDGLDQLSQANSGDVERMLLSENVVLYAVGHGAAREQPQRDALTRLCERTGGRVIFIRDIGDDLQRAFAALIQDIKSQYTLGFSPDPSMTGWQPIEVTLRERGHAIRARQGYEAGR